MVTPRWFSVPGTWGWRERGDPAAWFNPRAAFARVMQEEGLTPLRERPYWWTTRLQGHEFWRRWLAWLLPQDVEQRDLQDWFVGAVGMPDYIAAGLARLLCGDRPRPRLVGIGHSHGGNVLAIAVADEGVEIDVMVTVGMPVRAELADVYRRAAARVGVWIVLHASDGDDIQRRGEYGDGAWETRRAPDTGAPNVLVHAVPGADHSRLLREPDDARLREVWRQLGPVLRGERQVAA